jgi:hypothetical protein
MARWRSPYGSCPICGKLLDNCDALFANYHEHCLPSCELCYQEIRAGLCAAVYRAAGGKWTARHKPPCPPK